MMVETRLRSSANELRRRTGRGFDERYPETYKKISRSQFEERIKSLGGMIEEISEVDEEAAEVSDCSSSSISLDGPSPYSLPAEDRLWPGARRLQSTYFASSLISSRHGGRSFSCRPPLEHGFTEPVVRRKRYQYGFGERRNGSSFDQLSMDFLSLPPIPEALPLELCGGKASKYEEDGTDYDDSSECSDLNSSA